MSKDSGRRIKKSTSNLQTLKQIPFLQAQNEILGPIYSKAQFLRRQMENREPKRLIFKQEIFNKTAKQCFLEIPIDKDLQIEKQRKKYQSQNHALQLSNTNIKKIRSKTSLNFRQNERSKTKSLINFLANNKVVNRPKLKKQRQDQNKQKSMIEYEEVEDHFQPLGQQYKRQRVYQESLKSETQSLSSLRPESSLQSSKIGGGMQRQSSKNYLRKGTRVREILMRQLKTPDLRRSTASSGLTYLKQYDQWVPTALVQQKKAELQTFMNIIFGQKKNKGDNTVDLDKIHLIYL